MSLLVLIPTLAFVALNFVKVRGTPGGVRRAVVVWAALFAAAAVVLSRLPATFFYPENGALRTLESERYRLAEKPLEARDVVIVIEGSSAVAACVDGRELERLLRERGLPARVVQLATPGSNHFERLAVLREWLARLTPEQAAAFRKARVVLLREVLHGYDSKPFTGFVENAFGDRSIAYTTPGNVIPMLRTSWLASRDPNSADASLPLISAHFLFNVFRVGTIPMVKVEKSAYSNDGTSPTAGAERPRPERGKTFSPPYPWAGIYDRELNAAAAGSIDEIAWLVPPQLGAFPRKYARGFVRDLDPKVLGIDGCGDAVLAQLDGTEFWKDRVHVTAKGAEVFTAWLAGEIAAQWPRIAGEAD